MKGTHLSDNIKYLYEKDICSFEDISPDDRCVLTGHLLQDDDCDKQMEFLRDAPDGAKNTLVESIANYLIHQDRESAQDLLDEIKKMGATAWYSDEIDNLLEETAADYHDANNRYDYEDYESNEYLN